MDQTPSTILPTPQSTQSNPSLQTPGQKSNRLLIYILVLTVGTISLLIFGWVYFNSIQKLNNKEANAEVMNNLPVSLDNPYLSDIKLSYVFTGQLSDILSTPKGQQLITDIKGDGTPDFILLDSTKILIREPDGKVSTGVLQDLKKGDRLLLNASYDLKSKRWSIPLVKAMRTDFKNSPASSSASANPLP
ncbi:MAG: hypothetical protein ACD_30C00042G0019 [uncultured bacterium]|uniref:DUF5666 domain-containing protein n=4 Tax=Candidatus Daviesiibacteriota TaxID=1752718 RepID=A0A0G0ER42_9BACT|nr:MAG: hypothetical protein ACD_30C00042G0019 [uncultured bacterium]KKQ07972.1 MAG: hypothetical protein US19_C0034G0008 [Candidatus Daviesbacteria bacterium GW2011_GWB1_36_5]KKQ16087.1 MAG: hypothetical protein US28_C0005G0002 [Candidatus Daviesbacteria bacterium GW2011_GWA1_36_8]OGE17327.1 MAG: hypothetical protein A2858_03240 [Candidatus Daviesbacteria bacterium RIFCSPHIGHO2_01_FULL_36_37]OGE32222.1 MAG: hypothetical protein A3C99_02610 [Candidatus Daviesbacteria bacterium RIFCSPHIGHO2_02_F